MSASFGAADNNNQPLETEMISTHTLPSKDFSDGFDYAMVLPTTKEEGREERSLTVTGREVCDRMIHGGLDIFPYMSVQGDEMIVLIRIPDHIMKEFADKVNFKMLLDPESTRKILENGQILAEARTGHPAIPASGTPGQPNYMPARPAMDPHPAVGINKVVINDDREFCKYSPYEFLYGKYDQLLQKQHPNIYSVNEYEGVAFAQPTRLKLIYYLLKASHLEGGCDIQLNQLLLKDKILAFYPLHNRPLARKIHHHIKDFFFGPWMLPFDMIKDYFGEKLALYFQFIGHYSEFLFVPGVIGLAFQIVVWYFWNFSHPVLPFYGLLISVWAIVMLEYWKRKQCKIALKWGMSDFEAVEPERPEFAGVEITSYINGSKVLHFGQKEKDDRLAGSGSIIATFIGMVVGVVAGIYILRFSLQPKIGGYASTVASVLNSVQITVFNMVYQFCAKKLTDMENHRTDTMYEDSMITKLFVFQFVNSYSSFFFLAFVATNLPRPDALNETGVERTYVGQCGAPSCMEPLSINLAIIFGSRLFITNTIDMLLPYYQHWAKKKAETEGIEIPDGASIDDVLTPAEDDYVLQEYSGMEDNINVYADTVIQFGFMTMFVVALPISVIFTYLNNHVKIKLYAWKLLKMYQRPVPIGAQDIGTWQTIFTVISIISVITNAALIVFTMNLLWDYSRWGRLWVFIGFQWVLGVVMFMAQVAIPDVPEEVEIQLLRQDFIINKVVLHEPDEDFGEESQVYELEDDENSPDTANNNCCGKQKIQTRSKKIVDTGKPEPPRLPYPGEGDFVAGQAGKPWPNVSSAYLWPNPINKDNIVLLTDGRSNASAIITDAASYQPTREMSAVEAVAAVSAQHHANAPPPAAPAAAAAPPAAAAALPPPGPSALPPPTQKL